MVTELWREAREAVTVRAFVLVLGVLVLQLLFIQGYIGAFHRPVPQGIPVAVVVIPVVADTPAVAFLVDTLVVSPAVIPVAATPAGSATAGSATVGSASRGATTVLRFTRVFLAASPINQPTATRVVT